MKNHILFLVFISLFTVKCADNTEETQEAHLDIQAPIPNYLEQSVFNNVIFGGDDSANNKIHLGRVLFYEDDLSASGKVSCGSCHQQQFAFSDPFKHSIGIGSQLSERNTPSIVNATFSQGLFWDQNTTTLQELVTKPIKNHAEMGISNPDLIIERLVDKDYYPVLFERAFGDPAITIERMEEALVTFNSELNSFDAQIDRGELNAVQAIGQQLFIDKGCNGCHAVMSDGGSLTNDVGRGMFAGGDDSFGYTGGSSIGSVANIGLNINYADNGVGALNGIKSDNGKFKIPSLRNIVLTPPYMHDGRFQTLNEVLDFYSTDVLPHDNLDDRLMDEDGRPLKLNLSETEKSAIIAFLGALSSESVLTAERLSDPFLR